MHRQDANCPASLRVAVTPETEERIAMLADRHDLGMAAVARRGLELGLSVVANRLREQAQVTGMALRQRAGAR